MDISTGNDAPQNTPVNSGVDPGGGWDDASAANAEQQDVEPDWGIQPGNDPAHEWDDSSPASAALSGKASAEPEIPSVAAQPPLTDLEIGHAALICGYSAQKSANPISDAELAQHFGTSPNVIAARRDDFLRRYVIVTARDALSTSPVLCRAIRNNPSIGSQVQPDVPHLAVLENTLAQVRQPEERSLASDAWAGVENFVLKLAAFAHATQKYNPATLAMETAFPEAAARNNDFFDFIRRRANEEDHSPQRWLGQITSGVPYALFGPAAPFVAGGTEGYSETANLEDQGVDPVTAYTAGGLKGLILGAAQKVPLGNLKWGEGVEAWLKSLAGTSLKAGGVGAAQSVVGDATNSVVLGAGGYDQLAEQSNPFTEGGLKRAWDAALFQGGFHLGAQGVFAKSMIAAEKAVKAQRDFERLNTISEISQKAALREGNPAAYKQMVGDMAEGGDLRMRYVDGATFRQAMDKHGIGAEELAATLPDLVRQLPKTIEPGGEVSIPVEDYAAHIAGSDLDAELLPHFKADPEGMTHAKGQAFFRHYGDYFKEQSRRLAEQKQSDEVWKQSQQAVHDDVLRQLEATGRLTPDESKAGAALHRDFFTVLGDRLRIMPKEAYDRYGANIGSDGLSSNEKPSYDYNARFGQGGEDGRDDATIAGRASGGRSPADLRTVAGEPHVEGFWDATKLRTRDKSKPLIVYRGEKTAFTPEHFKDEALGYNSGSAPSGRGVHFADVKSHAQHHADLHDGKVSEYYVDMRNPYVHRNSDPRVPRFDTAKEYIAWRNSLRENGYDGIVEIGKQPDGSGWNNIIAFDPHQVIPVPKAQKVSIPKADLDFTRLKQSAEHGTARGYYAPEQRIIGLLKSADATTFPHETAHLFLDIYSRIAAQHDAPPLVKADMEATLKWFGVKDLAAWHGMSLEEQRPYHEQFAKGFETYLMEGRAPSPELRPIFRQLKEWLLKVYQSLDALGVKLSPEVRGVMDRMLAQEKQSAAARMRDLLAGLLLGAKAHQQGIEPGTRRADGNNGTGAFRQEAPADATPQEGPVNPEDAWKEAHTARARQYGLTPRQHEVFAPRPDRDPLTGLYTDHEMHHALTRAAKKGGWRYVEADLSNLGGINKFKKGNSYADEVLKEIGEVWKKHFPEISARRGGGRFAALMKGDPAQRLADVRAEVAKIIERHGLTEMPNAKTGGRGSALYGGHAEVKESVDSAVREAQDLIKSAEPKEVSSVNRSEIIKAWISALGGQARGIGARIAARARGIRPEASGGEGKEESLARSQKRERRNAGDFLQTDEQRLKEYHALAEREGLNPAQRDAFAPHTFRDKLTGWFTDRDRIPTIERARTYLDEHPEADATYASADVGNLGGLNEALGREHADKVFRNIADIFAEHLHALGGDVVKLRHGGDEFSAIVVGADKAAVEQALVAARREVAEYIHSIGLESLPHSKDPLNPERAGVGMYTAAEGIEGRDGSSAKEIIDRADREIELSKGRQKAEASASHAEPHSPDKMQ